MDYFGSVGSPSGIYTANHSIGVDLTEDRVPSRHFDGKVNKSIHENIQQKLRESLNELRQKEYLKQGMVSAPISAVSSPISTVSASTSSTSQQSTPPSGQIAIIPQQPMTLQSFLASNTDTLLLFMLFVVIILSFVQHIQIQHLSGKVDLLLMKNIGQSTKTG